MQSYNTNSQTLSPVKSGQKMSRHRDKKCPDLIRVTNYNTVSLYIRCPEYVPILSRLYTLTIKRLTPKNTQIKSGHIVNILKLKNEGFKKYGNGNRI